MTSPLSLSSTITLSNTSSPIELPRLGFGVYLSKGAECTKSCLEALKAGYRHIDSAQFYANEAEVGEAIAKSGIPRSEIFVTTKILAAGKDAEDTYAKCVRSVHAIDPSKDGYVDLFLIHSARAGPGFRKNVWQALERLYSEGKARSIGVSNWGVGHIEELKPFAKVWPPHVNQIELHPWCQQRQIVDYCNQKGIVIEAYSPLVRNQKSYDSTLVSIAEKSNKTTAQVLIRYCLQKGWVPLPKSVTPSRIVENADVYGFELSAEDMKALDDVIKDSGDQPIVQAVTNE